MKQRRRETSPPAAAVAPATDPRCAGSTRSAGQNFKPAQFWSRHHSLFPESPHLQTGAPRLGPRLRSLAYGVARSQSKKRAAVQAVHGPLGGGRLVLASRASAVLMLRSYPSTLASKQRDSATGSACLEACADEEESPPFVHRRSSSRGGGRRPPSLSPQDSIQIYHIPRGSPRRHLAAMSLKKAAEGGGCRDCLPPRGEH